MKVYFEIKLFLLMLLLSVQCSSMELKTENNSEKIISYSDLPFETLSKFNRIRYDFVWLFGLAVNYNGEHLDRILKEELEKIPNAKGIKNLKIRSYNSSNTSFQILYFPGLFFGYTMGAFGFSFRNVSISGEVF
jgi:hypothetical protein